MSVYFQPHSSKPFSVPPIKGSPLDQSGSTESISHKIGHGEGATQAHGSLLSSPHDNPFAGAGKFLVERKAAGPGLVSSGLKREVRPEVFQQLKDAETLVLAAEQAADPEVYRPQLKALQMAIPNIELTGKKATQSALALLSKVNAVLARRA